eukprot:snap_masked-scaffold_21-processed-gene-5.59-mRNA-1 protein AED:1.00 eAED:1.00 QI:0/0/0/0/1/1/2/0/75
MTRLKLVILDEHLPGQSSNSTVLVLELISKNNWFNFTLTCFSLFKRKLVTSRGNRASFYIHIEEFSMCLKIQNLN